MCSPISTRYILFDLMIFLLLDGRNMTRLKSLLLLPSLARTFANELIISLWNPYAVKRQYALSDVCELLANLVPVSRSDFTAFLALPMRTKLTCQPAYTSYRGGVSALRLFARHESFLRKASNGYTAFLALSGRSHT